MSHPPLPESYEGLLLQARRLQQAGQLPEAIALYERLLDRLGRLSDRILDRRSELRNLRKQAMVEIIGPLRWERRLRQAMNVQRELLALDPERANLWRRALASLRIESGEAEEGLADLRALAEEAPDDPWNWLSLGEEARIEGRFAESQPALERAVAAASAADDKEALVAAHFERFRLFKDMARWDDATASWERALKLDRDEVIETIPEVYKMLTDAGLYSIARTFVDRDPNAIRAGFQRGLLDMYAGRPIEAAQHWREVAQMDPTQYSTGQDAWMEAVLRLQDPEPVLDRLDELLARFGSPRVLILGGIAWAMSGERETARAFFERALYLLRRERPYKQKLDSADWRLLNFLVPDAQIKSALRTYFAVIETTWDRPEVAGPSWPVRS